MFASLRLSCRLNHYGHPAETAVDNDDDDDFLGGLLLDTSPEILNEFPIGDAVELAGPRLHVGIER